MERPPWSAPAWSTDVPEIIASVTPILSNCLNASVFSGVGTFGLSGSSSDARNVPKREKREKIRVFNRVIILYVSIKEGSIKSSSRIRARIQ